MAMDWLWLAGAAGPGRRMRGHGQAPRAHHARAASFAEVGGARPPSLFMLACSSLQIINKNGVQEADRAADSEWRRSRRRRSSSWPAAACCRVLLPAMPTSPARLTWLFAPVPSPVVPQAASWCRTASWSSCAMPSSPTASSSEPPSESPAGLRAACGCLPAAAAGRQALLRPAPTCPDTPPLPTPLQPCTLSHTASIHHPSAQYPSALTLAPHCSPQPSAPC